MLILVPSLRGANPVHRLLNPLLAMPVTPVSSKSRSPRILHSLCGPSFAFPQGLEVLVICGRQMTNSGMASS